MNPRYSLVVPIYNEEAVLPILLRRLDALLDRLDGPAEAIFVDDGSSDASAIVCEAKARADKRYRYIRLSRNFGHQIAITTGMDRARGDAVIVMDADLQDPPEVVIEMIAKWKEGFEIVYAERLSREGEGRFKLWTADLFYRLMARLSAVEIPRNVGDFRLVDRKVVDCFRAMPERDRFVRGMFAWLGFQADVRSVPPPGARGRRDEISASQNGASGGQWRGVVFRCAAAAGAVGRHGDLDARHALWLLGDRDMGLAGRSCARLEFVDRHHRLPVRRQYDDDGHYGPLCRAHLCRGEGPPALCHRPGGRVRSRAGRDVETGWRPARAKGAAGLGTLAASLATGPASPANVSHAKRPESTGPSLALSSIPVMIRLERSRLGDAEIG